MENKYYQDKFGTFFGRENDDGNIYILAVEDGYPATRLDASVYPVHSQFSARYEHPEGIVLTRADAEKIGLKIEK